MTAIIQFPFRLIAFAVGFFFYYMETAADWIIGVPNKTEFVRVGACKRCGRCCRLLALEMPPFISKREPLVKFLSWFHKICFNFQYQGREGKWLIYRCGYLEKSSPSPRPSPTRGEGENCVPSPLMGEDEGEGDRPRCRIYRFRHRLCRFYPHQRLYGHPKTHADCGFKFVRRDGKPTFDEILDEKRKSV